MLSFWKLFSVQSRFLGADVVVAIEYLVMVNGIRAIELHGLNKGRGSKLRVQQETPEEGRRTYRPKCCEYNNNDEDNSPKTLNDKK